MSAMKSYAAALAFAALAPLAACGDDASLTEPTANGDLLAVAHYDIPVTQTLSGQPSDTTRRRDVIKDGAEWTRFWASLKPDPGANGAAPSIDFSREMVIAAAMPVRPSGGFSITIESVTDRGDHLEARVVERSPAPDCATTAIVTRPFDVVQLRRVDKPVQYVERTEVTSCSTAARYDTVRAQFGRGVDARGAKVTLQKVLGDSRCPSTAVCVWEGDAAVTLRFDRGAQSTDVTLHTSPRAGAVSTTIAGVEYRLIGLTPYPAGGPAPNESAYTAILAVK